MYYGLRKEEIIYMANQKDMTVRNSILGLYDRGWSKSRIARELGVCRETVIRYVRLAGARSEEPVGENSKPTIPPTGNDESKPTVLPAGNDGSKCTISPAGKSGRRSQCEPYREQVELLLDKGLDAQRIWQDLRDDYGFAGSYDSVKRYIRKQKATESGRIYRIESLPGEEAQVDFGTGAWIDPGGGAKKRKSWIFRIILSCSRKGYSEAVFSQNAETFIRCLENAFRHFCGVPQTINLDNLRAAVSKADWYEPEINPKLEAFARHYGTQIMPCRPYTPEHKGKVESGVKYVKNNAIKGRTFGTLGEQNAHLIDWEKRVADCRIHGTTRRQVGKHFLEIEKDALLPLPQSFFPCYSEGQRKVHRDSYIEVDGSYYEVPQEYRSRQVWVRWDGRTVRVFNQHFELLRTFAKASKGQFSSSLGTRGRRAASVEQDAAWWIRKVSRFGSSCGLWAIEVVAKRGAPGIRVLQGLNALGRKHSNRAIDQVCEQAIGMSLFRLKDLKRLLEKSAHNKQENFEFMDKHPLIRDMSEYTQMLELLAPEQPTERY